MDKSSFVSHSSYASCAVVSSRAFPQDAGRKKLLVDLERDIGTLGTTKNTLNLRLEIGRGSVVNEAFQRLIGLEKAGSLEQAERLFKQVTFDEVLPQIPREREPLPWKGVDSFILVAQSRSDAVLGSLVIPRPPIRALPFGHSDSNGDFDFIWLAIRFNAERLSRAAVIKGDSCFRSIDLLQHPGVPSEPTAAQSFGFKVLDADFPCLCIRLSSNALYRTWQQHYTLYLDVALQLTYAEWSPPLQCASRLLASGLINETMSHTTFRIPELMDMVTSHLDLRSLERLRQVNTEWNVMHSGLTTKRLRAMLGVFFQQLGSNKVWVMGELAALMRHTKTIITGSFVVALLCGATWQPYDLDIVILPRWVPLFEQFIQKRCGYHLNLVMTANIRPEDSGFCPRKRKPTYPFDYRHYTHGERRIRLCVLPPFSRATPSQFVFSFCSTAVMNLWDGEHIYCLWPDLTFNKEFVISGGVHRGKMLEMAKKYIDRGFRDRFNTYTRDPEHGALVLQGQLVLVENAFPLWRETWRTQDERFLPANTWRALANLVEDRGSRSDVDICMDIYPRSR